MEVLDRQGRLKLPNFPVGTITPFSGVALPEGWALCDGTLGTPDLTDRFIVGDTSIGVGSAQGVSSATAALTHAGALLANHADHVVSQAAAHADHIVTQPAAHSAHTVGQPNNHTAHNTQGAHTHDAHTVSTRTAAGVASEVTTPPTHNSQGGHAHDAHSAHSGVTVDAHSAHAGTALDAHSVHAGSTVDAHSAHSVGQASAHSILKHYELAYVMKVSA